MPSWIKSGPSIRQKHHIVTKIKDLYIQHVHLIETTNQVNQKDKLKQAKYTEMLDKLLDISRANSFQMVKNEHKQFVTAAGVEDWINCSWFFQNNNNNNKTAIFSTNETH